MRYNSSKIRFIYLFWLRLFLAKRNARENRIFAVEWAVGEKKATHNVKIYAE